MFREPETLKPERAASFTGFVRALLLLAMAVMVGGFAPLTHSVVSLDGASADNPALVSVLVHDSANPLILHAIDGNMLPIRVPTAFRDWSFVVSPGRHVLWVSGLPYPHPLIPQHRTCYTLDAVLEAGATYILKEDFAREQAFLFLQGRREPVVTGRLVDRPWVFERDCRWE